MEFHNHLDGIKLSRIRQIGDKANQLEKEGKSIIRLQIGEPDFFTPQHIIDAAIESLNNKDTHYASNRGTLECRKAICEKLRRENNIVVDPEKNVLVVCGCAEALYCSIMGITDPGDDVIIIEPTFNNYVQITKEAGCNPVIVRADENNEWLPDINDIKKAITKNTKIIIYSSPNNPTGAVYPKELLVQIANLAIENNIFVISDEVYDRIIYDGREHVSIGSIPGMEYHAITINGMSKAFAMTGWRIGYIVAHEALITPILKVHQYATTCLPIFIQKAVEEALNNGEKDVRLMLAEYQERRDIFAKLLREVPGFELKSIPKGTFYIYPNISKTGLNSDEFVMKLLEDEGVACTFGTAFDRCGQNNIRFSFASSKENLIEGAARIKHFAEKLVK